MPPMTCRISSSCSASVSARPALPAYVRTLAYMVISSVRLRPRGPHLPIVGGRSDAPGRYGDSTHFGRHRDAHSAHRAQVPEVRPERRAQRALRDVADAVLLRVALHDLGDMGVVRVRDPWEQVVLDLVVEAPDHPAENRIAG